MSDKDYMLETVIDILKSIKDQESDRERTMPTEQEALELIYQASRRLQELGWRSADYCPKNGTVFNAIHFGDLHISKCHYDGKWPIGGTYWTQDDGDLWSGTPIMFKLIKEDQ